MRGIVLAVSSVLLMGAATATPSLAAKIKHVFVIAFENEDAKAVTGNPRSAPYIHSLLEDYASATDFEDELPDLDSEPHYIWMEAGTNAFSDHTFATDDDPSRANSTSSQEHLAAQIAASGRVTWATYQESIEPRNGACPIRSAGRYAAKHNPFVFFHDVAGNPPNSKAQDCKDHTKPYSAFAADLQAGAVADYVFITPDLCHDMHGIMVRRKQICPDHDLVHAGDSWLKTELPRIIDWAKANAGIIFLTWDENARRGAPIAFLAIGPGVKPGYVGLARYNHGSLLKSVEEIFGLPILPKAAPNNDLSDLFRPSEFP